jgi:hypothetical protein
MSELSTTEIATLAVDEMVARLPGVISTVIEPLAQLAGEAYLAGLADAYLDEVLPAGPAERAELHVDRARWLGRFITTGDEVAAT